MVYNRSRGCYIVVVIVGGGGVSESKAGVTYYRYNGAARHVRATSSSTFFCHVSAGEHQERVGEDLDVEVCDTLRRLVDAGVV